MTRLHAGYRVTDCFVATDYWLPGYCLAGGLAGWLASWLVGWAGWLAGRLIGLLGWLVGWLVHRLAG